MRTTLIVLGLLLGGCVTQREVVTQVVELPERIESDPDPRSFGEPYVVRNGDTLWSIARRFRDRDTLEHIIGWNDIQNPNRIYPGQIIYVLLPRNDKIWDAQQCAPPLPSAPQPGPSEGAR